MNSVRITFIFLLRFLSWRASEAASLESMPFWIRLLFIELKYSLYYLRFTMLMSKLSCWSLKAFFSKICVILEMSYSGF